MAQASTLKSLDLQALEQRTQAIGRELFDAARREHAHLSSLNRWTAQVLSWCLSDAALKGAVLRFIDVLPSLQSPHDIARHVQEYFPTTAHRLPAALRLGSQLARPGLLTHGALAALVTQLVEHVARQFIAESHLEAAASVMKQLAARGATCSLDILGEQVLGDAEADAYVAHCRALLEASLRIKAEPAAVHGAVCGPRANLSVKPSALTPRFDPISPTQSIESAAQRVVPLLELAADGGALINLDMEHYELRDLTLALAQHLFVHQPALGVRGARAELGIVVQAYLRDSEAVLEGFLGWLAAHERFVTVRLVKGAYWDYEVAQAAQRHWPAPVYRDKADTDAAFERLTRRLLAAHPLVTTAIASHNLRSIAHAMATAEALGLARDQLEFQLLYGMGEAIHAAIVERGYPVRVYTPIGALIPGMAYLVRRLLENTANESFLRQDFLNERSADALLSPPVLSTDAPGRSRAADGQTGWQGEPSLDFSNAPDRERMVRAIAAIRATLGAHHPVLLGDGDRETPARPVSHNPARREEALGSVSQAGPAEVTRAVTLAVAAQPLWARTPVAERVACLRKAAALMRAQRDILAAWEILEVGKPWREADLDVVEAIEYLEYYSEQMTELAKGKVLLQLPGERNTYRYTPRGVAAVISPWNFPLAIPTGMTSAALVAGNAVMLKPAGPSSIIAAHLVRLLREAGVPPAVIQYLPGEGKTVGAALVEHPATAQVLFTGSRAVGLSIIHNAAGRVHPGQRVVKHVVAEMGGKNAIIVDADADLDAVIAGTLRSAFGYAGQKCSAASRLIVHAAVYDRVLERLIAAVDRLVVGDPSDPASDVGPVIDGGAQRRLLEASERAARVGTVAYCTPAARLPTSGFFVGPVVATDIPPDDSLAKDELFGPLVCVFRVNTFDEALAMANDTDYALTGGVYSRSPSHLERAEETFDVGNLYLNRPITGAMVGRQPFGGHRLSGLGTKAGGPDYVLQFLLPKTICADTTRHGMPLE